MRLILAATAAMLCMGGQAGAETFNASSVRIEHAAAVLTVIPEDRANIDVAIASGGGRVAAPTARMTAEGLRIDGGLRDQIRGCSSFTGGGDRVNIRGVGNVPKTELPRITLRVPRALALSVGGAVYTDIGPSAGGGVTLNGCGDTSIGDASGALDVTLNGSGNVHGGRVGGALEATLNGSGMLSIGNAAGDATLRQNGSGDLRVANVTGRLDGRLNGSGSLNVGTAHDALLALNGSGNVEAGAINGSLDASLVGSGSIDIASVTGESATLRVSSSGNMDVRGGRVGRLDARTTGSGSIDFGGAAEATRATLTGSGNISIAEAGRIEQLVDQGSGGIRVGR